MILFVKPFNMPGQTCHFVSVLVYGTRNYDLLFSEFQKKYPGIKVNIATGSATEIVQRLMAERRANKYLRDLYFGAVTVAYKVLYKGKVLSPIAPTLILPEVVDRSKWWGGSAPGRTKPTH